MYINNHLFNTSLVKMIIIVALSSLHQCIADGNRYVWISDYPISILKGPNAFLDSQDSHPLYTLCKSTEFSFDGSKLLVTFGDSDTRFNNMPIAEVRLYDVKNQSMIAKFSGASSATFVDRGNYIVVCVPNDMKILAIDAESGTILKTIVTSKVESDGIQRRPVIVAGHPETSVISIGYETEFIRLYDIQREIILAERESPGIILNAPEFLRFNIVGSRLWTIYSSNNSLNYFDINNTDKDKWDLFWTKIQNPSGALGDVKAVIQDEYNSRIFVANPHYLYQASTPMWGTTNLKNVDFIYNTIENEKIKSNALFLMGVAYDPKEKFLVAFRSNLAMTKTESSEKKSELVFWDYQKPDKTQPAFIKQFGKLMSPGLFSMSVCSPKGLLALPVIDSVGRTTSIHVYEFARKNRLAESVVEIFGSNPGTGTVIGTNGIILTAGHVVGDNKIIELKTISGLQFSGTVLKKWDNDLAIIKVDSDKLKVTLPFDCATSIEKGQDVRTIGNPIDIGAYSHFSGVITNMYNDKLSVSINSGYGNSGAPLIDLRGRLIAVVVSSNQKTKQTMCVTILSICSYLSSLIEN